MLRRFPYCARPFHGLLKGGSYTTHRSGVNENADACHLADRQAATFSSARAASLSSCPTMTLPPRLLLELPGAMTVRIRGPLLSRCAMHGALLRRGSASPRRGRRIRESLRIPSCPSLMVTACGYETNPLVTHAEIKNCRNRSRNRYPPIDQASARPMIIAQTMAAACLKNPSRTGCNHRPASDPIASHGPNGIARLLL